MKERSPWTTMTTARSGRWPDTNCYIAGSVSDGFAGIVFCFLRFGLRNNTYFTLSMLHALNLTFQVFGDCFARVLYLVIAPIRRDGG